MKQLLEVMISHLLFIMFGVIILIQVLEAQMILSAPTYMALSANKAIQSLPGADDPILVPGVCEQECLSACIFNSKCLAYMFDGNDGACKIWGHLMIELIDRPNAKSWMQSMYHSLLPLLQCIANSVTQQGIRITRKVIWEVIKIGKTAIFEIFACFFSNLRYHSPK